jgi:hypothetical protein
MEVDLKEQDPIVAGLHLSMDSEVRARKIEKLFVQTRTEIRLSTFVHIFPEICFSSMGQERILYETSSGVKLCSVWLSVTKLVSDGF